LAPELAEERKSRARSADLLARSGCEFRKGDGLGKFGRILTSPRLAISILQH
jgi:hypothetical protein